MNWRMLPLRFPSPLVVELELAAPAPQSLPQHLVVVEVLELIIVGVEPQELVLVVLVLAVEVVLVTLFSSVSVEILRACSVSRPSDQDGTPPQSLSPPARTGRPRRSRRRIVLSVLRDLLVGHTVVVILLLLLLVMSGFSTCSNPILGRQGLCRRRVVPEVVLDRREEVELFCLDLRQVLGDEVVEGFRIRVLSRLDALRVVRHFRQ